MILFRRVSLCLSVRRGFTLSIFAYEFFTDRATELGQETDCSTEDCRGLFFVDFHSCYLPVLDTCTQLHKLHCNDMMDMDRNG